MYHGLARTINKRIPKGLNNNVISLASEYSSLSFWVSHRAAMNSNSINPGRTIPTGPLVTTAKAAAP